MQNLNDRDIRQRDIIPPERLAHYRATVIGAGSIGRNVASQLASIGIDSLHLVDPGVVAVENLACQGFDQDDLGRAKVEATADCCHRINPRMEILTEENRFRRSGAFGNAIFCCVDSIETRRFVWENAGEHAEIFLDGRMTAETIRIVTVGDAHGRDHFPRTLFAPDRAHRGSCTNKSTIFASSIAAGLMVSNFSKFLRRLPIDCDMCINLLAGEWTVSGIN
ncbi:MAG: hypothetical protein DHS20C16_26350 [Phycisphaerae bacterium]|nr:MAG: hypothetical protein DHS20C16_26350 [Phycisphaerae bacterium]